MCAKGYLVISGVIFALVCLAHLGRLIWQVPVQVGDWTAPIWPSWGGLVVAGTLSVWAFTVLRQKCE